MKAEKTMQNQSTKEEKPDDIRRDFLKKFGKYAATAPAVTFTLMSAHSSKAIASGGNDGDVDL